MHPTPSHLSEEARRAITDQLNRRLADGIDLQLALKQAHWNLKGPQFAAWHAMFEELADTVAAANDEIAERAVTLGALAAGTLQQVAAASGLPPYPAEATRDRDHAAALAERIRAHLAGLREARATAAARDDEDTVDLLTGVVRDLEKRGWFLLASLEA